MKKLSLEYTASLQQFSYCDLEFWLMTLTYKLDFQTAWSWTTTPDIKIKT